MKVDKEVLAVLMGSWGFESPEEFMSDLSVFEKKVFKMFLAGLSWAEIEKRCKKMPNVPKTGIALAIDNALLRVRKKAGKCRNQQTK